MQKENYLIFTGIVQGIFFSVMLMAIASPLVFVQLKVACCFWLLGDAFVLMGHREITEIFEKLATGE